MYICESFFQSVTFLFVFLITSFKEQRFLDLLKPILASFSFIICAFDV